MLTDLVEVITSDGISLSGAYFAPQGPSPAGVDALVFFHGDGGHFYRPLYLGLGHHLAAHGIGGGDGEPAGPRRRGIGRGQRPAQGLRVRVRERVADGLRGVAGNAPRARTSPHRHRRPQRRRGAVGVRASHGGF